MKATHVGLLPSPGAKAAGRPAVPPELLASIGASYSRNNLGLDQILSKIEFGNEEEVLQEILRLITRDDPGDVLEELRMLAASIRKPNFDKMVERIFLHVDYGHASIGDMAPVAIFLDGPSLFLAYYMWSVSPCASGQESSTRYIKIRTDELVDPSILGIPEDMRATYSVQSDLMFEEYGKALEFWQGLSVERPELVRIPEKFKDKPKERERIKRNYAFDRARVFLPLSAKTNVMMLMSARNWAQLVSHLASHPLPEFQSAANVIRQELELATPNMARHSFAKASTTAVLQDDYERMSHMQRMKAWDWLERESGSVTSADPKPFLSVNRPPRSFFEDFEKALAHRDNRYAIFGTSFRRTSLTWGVDAVSFGDVRDLNRHRPGEKWLPLAPVGFYASEDALPEDHKNSLRLAAAFGAAASKASGDILASGGWHAPYFAALGTQYTFEHTTTANNFIYEAELRTGVGSHYRYARHMHDVLNLFYGEFPFAKKKVLEGSAEPE